MSDNDLTASVALQMGPLPLGGNDLDTYTQQLTGYLATQIERFADHRGADVFLAVAVTQGDRTAAHEYRSGHYVKDGPGPVPTEDVTPAAKLAAVEALIEQARKVSPSPAMTIYVGDLEHALGLGVETVRGIVGAES